MKSAAEAEAIAKHEEAKAAAVAEESTGGTKKKYKWDIEHSDQYLWATSTGGSMRVNFGKKAPPSAPKKHADSNKILKTADGRVLKGNEVDAAVADMEADAAKREEEALERELQLARDLAAAGQLGDDGEFWVRCCPCCRTVLEEGFDEEMAKHNAEVEQAAGGRV